MLFLYRYSHAQGQFYFSCRDKHGVFVEPHKITLGAAPDYGNLDD